MVDAGDSKSSAARLASSSLASGTRFSVAFPERCERLRFVPADPGVESVLRYFPNRFDSANSVAAACSGDDFLIANPVSTTG
jgi:hypothetical protein